MNRRFIALVWVTLLASLGLAGGCSDSPGRQAGKNLRDQEANSQRYFVAALEMLGNPSYGNPAGRIVSLSGALRGEANDLTPLPPGTLNPEAVSRLELAIRGLDQAIAANGEANALEMSLALSQAGRIHELLGFCYAWDAAGKRGQIQDLLDKARREFPVLQVEAASLKYFNSFQSIVGGEANALADTSRKQAVEKVAKLKDLDAAIAALDANSQNLQERSQALAKEAGSLRMESKTATGQKALDLSEQSVDKQSQANKLASEMAGMQDALRNHRMDREFLAAEANLAMALTSVGESSIQSRADLAAGMLEKKNQIAGGINASQEKLDAIAGQMAKLVAEVRQSEEKAGAEFAQSAQKLDAARAILAPDSSLAINAASMRADVCIAHAKLLQASLLLRADLEAFAARVQGLWPQLERTGEAPALYAKLGPDYLPDPAAVKKAAKDLCLSDAVDSYRKYVIQQTKQELRWSPQALMGAAYLCSYEIGQDPADLKQAVEALDEAVKDKENSPYLVDAMELYRLAHELQQGPQPAAGT